MMWSNISATNTSSKQVGAPASDRSSDSGVQAANEQQQKQQTSGGSPLMRYKHAICSSPSGFIYIHGGRFGNLPLENDVWRFDPHKNTWTQLETSDSKCRPPSLQEHTLVEHQDSLYLFGGQVSASNQENSLWRLDLTELRWHSLGLQSSKFGAHLGPTNRRGHSAVVYNNSMYIFGGFEDFRGSSAQLWQYDLLQQRWELRNLSSTSSAYPEPRHSHSAIVFEDSMYVYGGLSDLKPLSDLWRWSWRSKRWFKEATRGQSPGQLHGHTAIQAFGSMFVFGGERQGRATRSLWRLNLSNMCWRKIRSKGPRPSPTLWHGAIANPLGILDETNYIIEGEDCEALVAAQVTSATSSLSDNFIYRNHRVGRDEVVVNRNCDSNQHNKLTRPNANTSTRAKFSAEQNDSIPHSKSMSSTGNGSSKPLGASSASKRKLRLGFLSRRRKSSRPLSSYELNQSNSNQVAANNATFGDNCQHLVETAPARHSSATDLATPPDDAIDVDMRSENSPKSATMAQLGILDNLDTDIKEMFERALSPSEEIAGQTLGVPASQTNRVSTNGSLFLSNSHSTTYRTAMDASTLASDSSATLGGGPSSRRTSYATATNGSSSTIGRNLFGSANRRLAESPSAATSRDRSGGNRPKSEIVQSLIDRADDQIKHLNTAFFGHNQTQEGYEMLLGELQNHRMFQKASQRDNKHRHSFMDRSKRHTIHQTMTYYNLYFADEAQRSGSVRHSANEQAHNRFLRDNLSSNAIATQQNAFCGSATTSGTLIGVRGTGSSNGSQQDGQSQLSLETVQNSSESQTILGQVEQSKMMNGYLLEPSEPSDQVINQRSPVQSALTRRDTSDSGDNTSRSCSVIVEYEEDDPFCEPQYSRSNNPIEFRDTKLEPQSMQYDGDNCAGETLERILGQREELEADNEGPFKKEEYDEAVVAGDCDNNQHQTQLTRKSTSSGYDSYNSPSTSSQSKQPKASNNLSEGPKTGIELRQAVAAAPETHLTATCRTAEKSFAQTTTTSSSITADSLALTTTSEAFENSSAYMASSRSMQDRQQQQQNGCQSEVELRRNQRAPFMARSARFFSKKKSKNRYWQLCMFVIGGKQGGAHGVNEPITIWRLYI